MTMPNPPVLPQALLHLLLPVERRASVVGDLLEEYRDSRVPSMGRFRANLWYWKQVFGLWLRAYWAFVVPVFGLFAIRDVLSVFRSPSGLPYFNVEFLFGLVTWSPFVFLLTGAYGSWRTRRWAGGIVAVEHSSHASAVVVLVQPRYPKRELPAMGILGEYGRTDRDGRVDVRHGHRRGWDGKPAGTHDTPTSQSQWAHPSPRVIPRADSEEARAR